MKSIATNHITPAALKELAKVAEEMGYKVFAEPLTETACTFEEDGENPCSLYSVSITKDKLMNPNDPNGKWHADAYEKLSVKELHEVYQKAGLDFDLTTMLDATADEVYNTKVVDYGTDEPYYYWRENLGLEIVFKLVENTWEV